MTQEEKFEEAKRLYETANADQRYVLESLFPELKESEDEKVRKEIIAHIKWCEDSGYCAKEEMTRWITFLEKQWQKPVWSEEDKNMLEWVIAYFNNKMLNTPISEERTACKNAIAWLKDLKDRVQPQSQWKPSDEQMFALNIAIEMEDGDILKSLYEQLKKLREE